MNKDIPMQAHVMPILPPPTYDEVQTERLQEVENFYKQNKDRNSRNDFTIIDLGPHGQEFTAPNQTLDLELNEQRLRAKKSKKSEDSKGALVAIAIVFFLALKFGIVLSKINSHY